MMEYATHDEGEYEAYEDEMGNNEDDAEDQLMMEDQEGGGDEGDEGDFDIDYEQEAYAYQQQLIQQQRQQQIMKQHRQMLLKKANKAVIASHKQKQKSSASAAAIAASLHHPVRNGNNNNHHHHNGSLLKQLPPTTSVTRNNGNVMMMMGGGSGGRGGSQNMGSSLTLSGSKVGYYHQNQKQQNKGQVPVVKGKHYNNAEMLNVGYFSEEDQQEQEGGYCNGTGEELFGGGDYADGESNGQGEEYYGGDDGDMEEEEYPDMLQFCEAQFDDEEDDDEEERGLPPVPQQGNYGNTEDYSEGSSRITTNEAGIRIVESSSVYEPEGEELDYEQFQYVEQTEPMPTPPVVKKVQMNKPRKIRPEKLAAEAYLRQLQSNAYDNFKPNILARKLMGVPSQTVQATRPPPLLHKSLQQGNKSSSTSPTTVSLESILRQQRPTNTMPRLQAKTASSLVIGNQLKIKPNHIPSVSELVTGAHRQKEQQMVQFQKLQMAPTQMKSLKYPQTNSSKSGLASKVLPKQSRSNNFQYQQASSSQLNSSSSARTNGISSSPQSLLNNNRLNIASIQQQVQQQQKNALLLQSPTKSQKNVPRCPICKRTFATNQVLQRHMVLHGPVPPQQAPSEPEVRTYKCEECFEEFTSPVVFNEHMQSHDITSGSSASANSPGGSSSPSHRCRVCYRTFTCMESLKAHSLMHDGEFKCRACRRGFSDWNALEEHEATHKRYNCQWCEKYFMNSGNLKAHERIHTGERPYKCNDCPKAFKQLGGLQYHLKTNPNHKPQKYHKHDMEGSEGNEDGYGYQYANYEDYEDGDGILNMSLADIAAANGL